MSHRPFIALLAAILSVVSVAFASAEDFPRELVEFTPHAGNPVFLAAGAGHWDVKIRERGWILYEPATDPNQKPLYRLWYTGYDGTREGVKSLGYATSEDGIQWKRHPDNPIYKEHWIEDVTVIKHGNIFVMFAEGRDDQAQMLESTDGIAWKRIGQLDVRLKDGTPIAAGPYGTPAIWFEDGTWSLFYERRDAGVWLATSRDRKVWRNVQDEPVLVPGPASHEHDLIAMNQIVKHGGKYYGFYHGSKQGSGLWGTNIAVSNDLIHWTKYARNPLFPIETNKSSGILVPDGRGFRLYTMHDKVQLHWPVKK
jgi:sucrose-6-phosphate hydrolase SacC (GH32 family)